MLSCNRAPFAHVPVAEAWGRSHAQMRSRTWPLPPAHVCFAPGVRHTPPQFCPWKDHLYDLEKEGGFEGQLLFCVYQDDRDKSYRVQVGGGG